MQSLLLTWAFLATATPVFHFSLRYFVEGPERMKQATLAATERVSVPGYIAIILFCDILVPPIAWAGIAYCIVAGRRK